MMLLCCWVSLHIYAQEESHKKQPPVAIKVKVTEDAILLRWAPSSPKAWIEARKHGFILEKYTISISGKVIDYPEKQVLGSKALFPVPLEEWEAYADTSDYAAVIAQAFFGHDFSLGGHQGTGISQIINQSDELQQRFQTSVFMAENDFKAASLAAWAWKDTDVKKGEKYLYRVYINESEVNVIDTVAVFTGLDDYRKMPLPIGLQAVSGDKSIMLSWNYAFLSGDYHSYHIERKSEKEVNFQKITDLPVTPLFASGKEMFFVDSLESNDIKYAYRIRGVDSFGECGPYSDVVAAEGTQSATCLPQILSGEFINSGQATIYWEPHCEQIDRIHSFGILSSNQIDGLYKTALKNISQEKRELTFFLNEDVAYVKLIVYDLNGDSAVSLPYYLLQTDSIPPLAPLDLEVSVDSLGIARLMWTHNKEPDFAGYRVARSFAENEEQTVLTPQFISEAQFSDTLSLSTINRKVYYAVSAIDHHFNESAFCLPVLALKPDNTPPAEPVFSGYKVEDGSIELFWITDPQDDVIYYLLRKAENDTITEMVFSAGNAIQSQVDYPPQTGCYEYTMLAIDKSNNVTKSPASLKICIHVPKQEFHVGGFSAFRDRINEYIELSWHKHPQALSYRIYKNEPDKALTLWKELDASVTKVTDENIYPASTYQYTIILLSHDGQMCRPQTIIVK